MRAIDVRLIEGEEPSSGIGAQWEALVAANPASGVMQSLRWAKVRASFGGEAVHLGAFDGGRLVGGVLWHGPVNGAEPSLLIAPDGPVVPWERPAEAAEILRALMAETRGMLANSGIVGLRIEPRLGPPRPSVLRDFHRAPVDVVPPQTLYLDLEGGQEALLEAMHPKWRYNIRLAARRGVTVREDPTPEAIGVLYGLMQQAAAREQFFLEPPGFFAALYEHLVRAGVARILVAEHEGAPLAAMLLVTFGQRATYLYGGTANAHRELMAGHALQWAAIRASIEAGAAVYDFYGFEPFGLQDHLFAGFSRFKRGFGGRAVQFIGAQDHLLVDNLASAVVRLATPVAERTPA